MNELIELLKKQLEFYRDKWMDENEPEFQRGKYHGRYFAYKEILDNCGHFKNIDGNTVKELARALTSLKMSMQAHPDYKLHEEGEFVDMVNMADEVLSKLMRK